jgi:acyl-CoA synthetase (AMP-forming)/AMP-acid ligase II
VSITVGPNFSLDMCSDVLSNKEVQGLDLSRLERLYCGAEPISPDTLERFLRAVEPLGFDPGALTPCYGMAEATLYVSGKPGGAIYRSGSSPEPSGTDRPVVSCGEVDSEHVVRIVDPTGLTLLDDGQVGEIWVTGPSVAVGYYGRPEQSRQVFEAELAEEGGPFLRTGDLGFLRAGELFVTGRIKDLVIVNGRNIYPQDVEGAVVRANPDFRLAVAFSIPDKSSEQLCVVAETGHRNVSGETYSTMVEAIRSSIISEFGIKPHIHIAPKRTIPTTTSGKVRRQETRRMFLANELRSVHVDAVQECTA